jgi:hypothetical protein
LFIIRALFWLTVVLLLIPGSGGKDRTSFTSSAANMLCHGILKAEDVVPRPLPAARPAGKA